MTDRFYPPPVDRLLALGAEPARRRVWPDYRNLGLEARHAPALVRMATDPALHGAPERDPAGWAPVHAWRALGQLRAEAAAEPLLALLEREPRSGWVYDEVPAVLGMIGPAALPGATLLLFDESRDDDVRIAAIMAIADVGHEHPPRHGEAAALLAKQLEDWAHQSRRLNAWLVLHLVEMEAVDAAPLMEAAFAAGAVETAISGDWEGVQVELGLLPERATPPADPGPARPGAREPSPRAAEQAKRRKKAEKAARKRNRKKR